MKSKKEIGQVFKKRLEVLNDSPDDIVWKNIEIELRKKKKRTWIRVIVLILFLILGTFLLFENDQFEKNKMKPTQEKENFSTKKSTSVQNEQQTPITEEKTTKKTIKTFLISKQQLASEQKINTNSKTHFVKKEEKFPLLLKSNGMHIHSYKFPSLNLTSIEPNEKEKTEKRWSISLVNGVNYLNTNNKRSAINNVNSPITQNKENSFTHSFGIYVNYDINKKITFRLGLQRLVMDFNTRNIPNNIPQVSSILGINEISSDLINTNLMSLLNNDASFNIKEQINYVEIPIEFKYRLFKKIPNLKLISGFSYLFVSSNTIYVYSKNTEKFIIGSSKNLKDSTLSFNIGINHDFQLSSKFFLNVELNYKQYFNTFDFNQLNLENRIINLQTGITYKF